MAKNDTPDGTVWLPGGPDGEGWHVTIGSPEYERLIGAAPALGIAGNPPEGVDAPVAVQHEPPREQPATDEGSEPNDYESMTVDDLQAEADRKGLEVKGTGKDGNVLKRDLVAALNDEAA